jgi:hypothetical protein
MVIGDQQPVNQFQCGRPLVTRPLEDPPSPLHTGGAAHGPWDAGEGEGGREPVSTSSNVGGRTRKLFNYHSSLPPPWTAALAPETL